MTDVSSERVAIIADFHVGTTVTIAADIVADGIVTFGRGEQVLIQQVLPNPQWPDYKYTVMSARTGNWYQLRAVDVIPPFAPQPFQQQPMQPPPMQYAAGQGAGYPSAPQYQVPPPPQPQKSGTFLKGCLITVGILVVLGVVAVVLLVTVAGLGVHKVIKEAEKLASSMPGTTKTPSAAELGVPIYPGARGEGGLSLSQGLSGYTFHSKDAPDKVIAWYRQQLSGKPDYTELVSGPEQLVLSFRSDSATMKSVSVGRDTANSANGQTLITITSISDASTPPQ
jgi:hypothetical protein